MEVENPLIEKGRDILATTENRERQKTKLDLEEAREPLGNDIQGFAGPCSNSGNGCTGSCNHSSK